MARMIKGNKVEESSPFEPIPAGRYPAYIYEVKEKEYGPNSSHRGLDYYNIQFRITGPKYDNRVVWSNVGLFPNWKSGSENFTFFQLFSAVRGMREVELRKEFNENGGIEIPDPEEMEGILVEINVGIQKDNRGVAQNEVRGIFPATDGPVAAKPAASENFVELDL